MKSVCSVLRHEVRAGLRNIFELMYDSEHKSPKCVCMCHDCALLLSVAKRQVQPNPSVLSRAARLLVSSVAGAFRPV
eukprot:378048-Amphidinium_carterae.1